MKTISVYKCEICGAEYKEKEKAESCESKHVKFDIDSNMEREYQKGHTYPEFLTFTDSDKDKKITYIIYGTEDLK
jgi:hypothetical protein